MVLGLGRIFGRVFRSIIRGTGEIGKRLIKTPTGHLVQVFRVSRNVKSTEFKKTMSEAKPTQEEQAQFYAEAPGFVNYVTNLYTKGRNRNLIAQRKPIKMLSKTPAKQAATPKPAEKKQQKTAMAA
ncbi:hypothetical protein HY992_00485 [Candidatus Micrarchaeota archaeon]|nr:hypothetical protein [Candidatus Micrarchaeota archaeon]